MAALMTLPSYQKPSPNPPRRPGKIYVDCTDIAFYGGNTGIQRVARNLAKHAAKAGRQLGIPIELIALVPPIGFINLGHATYRDLIHSSGLIRILGYLGRRPRHFRRICKAALAPIGLADWIDRSWRGKYRLPLIALLFFPMYILAAGAVLLAPLLPPPPRRKILKPGDILVLPGTSWWGHQMKGQPSLLKKEGIQIVPLLHDLFPITHPEFVRADVTHNFTTEIDDLIKSCALIIANSQCTAIELKQYCREKNLSAPSIIKFCMGVELDLTDDAASPREDLVDAFSIEATYLNVGTIEPRKNHILLLDAFEQLWKDGSTVRIVLVGKYGWRSEATRARITSLIEQGRPLYWFQDLSDSELAYCYKRARAMVYSSFSEGFGLPLLEALLQGCPVLASDIPVFREIGNDHCRYFPLDDPETLADLIQEWANSPPPRPKVEWPNWEKSAVEFFGKIRDHFHTLAS